MKMGRGKAVLGLISILIGEFLIFLFIQDLFLLDWLDIYLFLPIMVQIGVSMPYLVWIFLIAGIGLIAGGIYMMVKSKFPSESSSSGYYPNY